jgi:hypothetical protein
MNNCDANFRTPIPLPRCRPQRRSPTTEDGQAYLIVAIVLVALCATLALAVDVGVTTMQYQGLRHDADSAAFAGSYALYGRHSGARASLTDDQVYSAVASKLSAVGLTVASGPGTGTPAPADPCNVPYLSSQVALTATYLDATDAVITSTGTTPWTVGSGSVPPTAYGVDVTLGTCRSAAFGGVLGHPSYTIWVDGSAGQPPGGALPTPTSSPLSSTAPFAISAAPNGNCNGVNSSSNLTTTLALGDDSQFYCSTAYTLGGSVTLFTTSSGNTYGNDGSFRGYIGSPWTIGQERSIQSGGGSNGPTSCPSQVTAPIISRLDHIGNSDNFVVLASVVANVTSCGSPTTGTIASVCDPYGFGIVGPAPTATATGTPTATPTPAPTVTPIPISFQSSTTATDWHSVTSLTIPVPSGVQANDLLIVQITVHSIETAATWVLPGGWTLQRSDNSSPHKLTQAVFYRVSDGSEPSSYSFRWSGSGDVAGSMADYSGVDPTSPINADSGNATTTKSNSITAPGVTTTTSNALVIGFFGIRAGTTISLPAGETQRWTATQGSITLAGGDQTQAVAGPTGALVASAVPTAYNAGQLVALKPVDQPTNTPTPTFTPSATPTNTLTPAPTCTPPAIPTLVPPVAHHG